MSLSSQTIQDKNALSTDAVFLVLLEINIPSVETIRLINNTEDITWDSALWQQFPFTLSDISQTSKSEVSQWTLKVANATRVMERYMQDYDFYLKNNGVDGNEIECIIRVINTNDIDNTTPIAEFPSLLQHSTTDAAWATFKLTSRNLYSQQFPQRIIYKNFCSWDFKSTQCQYSGDGEFCDKTLTNCRAYSNSPRFGGFPGVSGRGLVVV